MCGGETCPPTGVKVNVGHRETLGQRRTLECGLDTAWYLWMRVNVMQQTAAGVIQNDFVKREVKMWRTISIDSIWGYSIQRKIKLTRFNCWIMNIMDIEWKWYSREHSISAKTLQYKGCRSKSVYFQRKEISRRIQICFRTLYFQYLLVLLACHLFPTCCFFPCSWALWPFPLEAKFERAQPRSEFGFERHSWPTCTAAWSTRRSWPPAEPGQKRGSLL